MSPCDLDTLATFSRRREDDDVLTEPALRKCGLLKEMCLYTGERVRLGRRRSGGFHGKSCCREGRQRLFVTRSDGCESLRRARCQGCYEGGFRGGVDRDVEEKNGKFDPRVRRSDCNRLVAIS
jgi:hypothetical protein